MNDPWLSFIGPIIAALIIGSATVYSVRFGVHIFKLEQEAKRNYEILQERKAALFDALHVVDLVYANERLNNMDPLNPKEWDINLARNAMNKMLIYCKDPNNMVTAFNNAVGLYNPDKEAVPGIKLESLDEFRKQIACELNLPKFEANNPDKIWIYSLTGTKEAKELATRKERDKEMQELK